MRQRQIQVWRIVIVILGALNAAATPGPSATPIVAKFQGDPAAQGEFSVYERSIEIPATPEADATFFGPSRDGGKSLADDGPYPLILLLPGFGASFRTYAFITKHLVSWGYIVVGINFEQSSDHVASARQVQKTIDWALDPKNSLSRFIDPEKIATAGHSFGGKMAIYAACGDTNAKYPSLHFPGDPRIKIILAWDPVDGGPPCPIAQGDAPGECRGYAVLPQNIQHTKAKIVVFGGQTGDPNALTCTPADRTHAQFFEAAKTTTLHVTFPDANHMTWTDQGRYFGILAKLGQWFCGDRSTPDTEHIQKIALRTQMAWLLKYFANLSGMETFLTGPTIQADCNQGRVCQIEFKDGE